jgi:hypothetical protein
LLVPERKDTKKGGITFCPATFLCLAGEKPASAASARRSGGPIRRPARLRRPAVFGFACREFIEVLICGKIFSDRMHCIVNLFIKFEPE